ncbi:hypothetical protein MWG07_10890 [Fusobacterium necrophorum]|uniref:Uncharacterized protein n=1 Tax=Fusobacterium necrophorum TaxID=859 RepID=A0AAW6WE39_9FUSO|nr:hypothetical protein [Fusobacterium necrophorum]MDK4481688.1 hypothetical protein [Fusobacterium necrophorum]MDK4512753.1 hypothetical protein [Fusobacterium necrophorum]
MAVRKLSIDIMSYLKGKGFEAVDSQIKKVRNSLSSLKSFTDSSLFKMAAGYFTVNTLISQYNKAVEASNTQIEHETKLYAALKAQDFRDEQIESLKQYAGELQKVGIIGDESSLAGIRQLASFKLQEKSIRELLPQVHNLMVAEKGVNSTIADSEKWSKALGIAVSSGQVRALKQAGVVLDDHTAKLFESANEQQRVAILAKELKERVGEQNAEFLKTPEGKIISAQNRIGDIYEVVGGVMRETRGELWNMIADNAEWLQDFFVKVAKTGTGMVDTVSKTVGGLFNTFKAMPQEARDIIKLLSGFFLISKFPIAGVVLILEDIFAAFQGKEAFTEDAINALLKFTGTDYHFDDLRKEINDFWHDFISPADQATEKIGFLTADLEIAVEILKAGAGFAEMILGVPRAVFSFGKLIGNMMIDPNSVYENWEDFNENGLKGIKHGASTLMTRAENMTDIGKRYRASVQEKKDKEIQEAATLLNTSRLPKKDDFQKMLEMQMNPSVRVKKEVAGQVTYTNKPQYTFHITGLDASEVGKEVRKEIEKKERENEQKWKAQVGGNFSLAGLEA